MALGDLPAQAPEVDRRLGEGRDGGQALVVTGFRQISIDAVEGGRTGPAFVPAEVIIGP